MDWYYYMIYVLLGVVTILSFLFFIARDPVFIKLKVFFGKRKSILLVHEMLKCRKAKTSIAKFEKKHVTIDGSTYAVDSEHIYFDPIYNISSVVVSEKIGHSVNPDSSIQEGILSPKLVESLIMESVLAEVGEKLLKLIQFSLLAVAICVIIMLIQCGALYYFYNALSTSGVNLSL